MESKKLKKCQEKEKPYQQVFLVLGKSEKEVHDKIKSFEAFRETRLDFIEDTEKTEGKLKVILVKFKTNVRLDHVAQIFKLVDWDLNHIMKKKYAKKFHQMKKDEVKLMETGISYEYLKQRDQEFELTKGIRKSVEKELKQKLKNCIVNYKTPENDIRQYALQNGKNLILEILKKKWENFNKLECKLECVEPYCRNLIRFQDYVEKR